MTRAIAAPADAGRACPYCRFPLKEGLAAERCDSCRSLHHEDCWRDGGGCAVLGCPEGADQANPLARQPHASVPSGVSYVAAPPPGYPLPAVGSPPGPLTSPFPPASGSGAADPARRAFLPGAVFAAVIGVAVGVLVASGALKGKTAGTTAQTSKPAAASVHALNPAAARVARGSVLDVLDRYTHAYSSQDLRGLASVLTPGVKRHGLAGGGCHVVRGREAVLRDYESQFDEGTGTYRLVGLSPRSVTLAGSDGAHVRTHYAISTGGAGFVNFALQRTAAGWKISEVFATCA